MKFNAIFLLWNLSSPNVRVSTAKLADRSRVVKARKEKTAAAKRMNSQILPQNRYPMKHNFVSSRSSIVTGHEQSDIIGNTLLRDDKSTTEFERELGSQLSGCCSTYKSYSAAQMCSLYGEDCYSANAPSHDSGDDSCKMVGLSFIGLSFSVNSADGNPYSYQLCDQFPLENLIDRNYDYVMSMDEDGWLVGGGYKSFDYSGKMPYIDSSHTELLRIGSLDPSYGGTTINQVYEAMSSISFPPFSIYPEYVKGGGGHKSNENENSNSVPSSDITLIVSIVANYEYGSSYSTYEIFLNDLFKAMYAVSGGPCMDDEDTDPHVSMARGVKFKSYSHQSAYLYKANLEVAVWQAMYPNGVVIGSKSSANFPPNNAHKHRSTVGYGNLYFFFDRANITKSWAPNRQLTSSENYYATLYDPSDTSKTASFYSSTTNINFNYNKQSGSRNNNKNSQSYEHNPYIWNAKMARHDMTSGWDLPPNCYMEGETFFGIPLSRASNSKLQSTSTFQDQFDFEYLTDRNYTYMKKFGTNHGWLAGEVLNNGPASIVDKDTLHIPIFFAGTTNPDKGGMSLTNMIKIAKDIDFGTLYIKPAFVFQDSNDGHLKLQFEVDPNSALAYLYDNLCKMMGIPWNGVTPWNKYGVYTNCAMHSAGDRASYGCGPGNGNYGGFCPQMTIAYRVKFQSEEAGIEFISRCNAYIDFWRQLYPTGVAVGTSKFCPVGGCLGLFLNRYDLYQVFKPDKGGSWVQFNGAQLAPTVSPAPTYDGGCNNVHNKHLDKCYKLNPGRSSPRLSFDSLGTVGKFSFFLLTFMSITLGSSIFLARARKRRRRGESYLSFFWRDLKGGNKKKKIWKKQSIENKDLTEEILSEYAISGDRLSEYAVSGDRPRSRSRSKKSPRKVRKKSRSRKVAGDGGDLPRSGVLSSGREEEVSEEIVNKSQLV